MQKFDFKPYKSSYPQSFEIEKDRIKSSVAGDYEIEHVGSTSVPNLGGKGIIDILIVVKDKSDLNTISTKLQEIGYIFRPLASTPQRLFLRQEYPNDFDKDNAYHIHLTYKGNPSEIEMIAFRNYLRSYPDDLKRYEDIKIKASKESNHNREVYADIKGEILKEILNNALRR